MNMRILISSLVMFGVLMVAWSYVTDRGYEKVKPQIEMQQQRIKESQEQAQKVMRENLELLGMEPDEIDEQFSMQQEIPEEFKGRHVMNPLRPEGTYMGVFKGASTKIAMAKFKGDRYWIMVKDPMSGDTKEKGKFDFQLTDIYFQPNDERDYFATYEQISFESFRIVVGAGQFMFEKTNDVKLDF